MKIIIDSENMKLNYEPLEKGQEYDVDAQIGKIWVESGRAHRTGSDSGKKSLSDEDDLKEEEMPF
ncbi:MAG: hypothetical protein B6241_12470 [Spirochaetaceae bacterium 4572_59]|nr:MAG: hypothetical protein B6241_12470 [Spirochaetaceae bacterium 4572_59]